MSDAFCMDFVSRGIPTEGDTMKKDEKAEIKTEMRADPEARICEKFDATSIAKFTVAKPGKMGMRVVDDCAEEHIM